MTVAAPKYDREELLNVDKLRIRVVGSGGHARRSPA